MKKKNRIREYIDVGKFVVSAAWSASKSVYLLILLADTLAVISGYVQVAATGLIVDELFRFATYGGSTDRLYIYLSIFVGALILPAICAKVMDMASTIYYRYFVDYMNLRFFRQVTTRDIQIVEDPSFRDSVQKAEEQSVYHLYSISIEIINIATRILGIGIAVIYLGSLDWRLSVLGVLAALPAFIVEFMYGQRIYGIYDDASLDRRLYQHKRTLLFEKKSLIEIKLFQNVNYFLSSISTYLTSFTNRLVKGEKKRIRDEIIGVLIYIAAFVGVVIHTVQGIISKTLSVGQFTVVLGAFSKLENDLSGLFKTIGSYSKSALYANDIITVMRTENILIRSNEPVSIPGSTLRIDIQNLWFKYPGAESYIFKNLNLTFNAGSKIALVGHNGAGKTTLVHLLLRIYDPESGKIFVNGIDIRELSLEEYYARMAVLTQEFADFKLRTDEVIALGNTNKPISTDEVKIAARKANASSFIESWPNGYESQLGREYGGQELSGGERQRMAIARVMYRDADFIILDEPTSAVDAIAEQEIFESLYKNSPNKTLLTISHRFSTVRQSDTIIVLEHGEVQEMGSHDELIAKKGRYHELYSAQASAYR